MTFSNYICHATALCKNLNVVNLNDFYRLESAKCMHKLHHGALLKIYDHFFKIFPLFILEIPESIADN